MKFVFFSLLLLLTSSCCNHAPTLSKVHLTTEKGLTQTLTGKDRLKPFESEAFILHQPHKKVVRVYDGGGDNKTIITTYHSSGQLFQLLECKNNQACGAYEEWGTNGKIRVKASVIGGSPQIDPAGNLSWIFQGLSEAFDSEGNLIAAFNYENGLLEGEGILYYPSGEIKQKLPYKEGLLSGTTLLLDKHENVLEKINYIKGVKHGAAIYYWTKTRLAGDEKYVEGRLVSGLYFNMTGKLIAQIKEGSGHKAIWKDGDLYQRIEYRGGIPNGEVLSYNAKGSLTHKFNQFDGKKTGEEVLYDPRSNPKLSINWKDGVIHGSIQTWYPNGVLESEREMSHNKKHGIFRARYENGNLMLIEEYENDLLIKGQYFKNGLSTPCSTISMGEGEAFLFDSSGLPAKRVLYQGGKPVE
ncbi:MAG: hypothetical protein S4CHLAM7_11010 [Chlamydiae bacterium]|nr:hypothetical protein [Chlamydiota bacterium]